MFVCFPRNTAANRTRGRLVAEFGVLHCEHVALQVGVLGLLFESGLVVCNLLFGECFDGSSCLCELGMGSQFGSGVWLFVQVSRETDTSRVERFLFLGEIGIGVGADFSPIEIHHVNRFILSHVVRAILVSATKLRFMGSYSDALTLRSAKTSFYVPRESPLSSMRGIKV